MFGFDNKCLYLPASPIFHSETMLCIHAYVMVISSPSSLLPTDWLLECTGSLTESKTRLAGWLATELLGICLSPLTRYQSQTMYHHAWVLTWVLGMWQQVLISVYSSNQGYFLSHPPLLFFFFFKSVSHYITQASLKICSGQVDMKIDTQPLNKTYLFIKFCLVDLTTKV